MATNLEDYNPDQNIDQQYIQSYGEDFSVHKLMLSDKPRMDFYHDAIKRALSDNNNIENKFVIDCGAGSGVLSMLAIKYGARKVYSIEASERIAQTILPNIKRNMKNLGISSAPEIKKRFSLHQGMAETFPVQEVVEEICKISDGLVASSSSSSSSSSPVREDEEPVKKNDDDDEKNNNDDKNNNNSKITIYLVSEWMGFYLLHEAMLQSVLFLRDKILAEIRRNNNNNSNIELKLIPDVAEIYCAPFDLRKHYESSIRPSWQFLDLDFSFLGEVDAAEVFSTERNPVVQVIHENSIVKTASPSEENNVGSTHQRLITLDLLTVTIDELEELTFSASFHFPKNFAKANPTTTIHGFAIWFSCFFVDLDQTFHSKEGARERMIKIDGVKVVSSSMNVKYDELSTSPFDVATHWKQTVVMMSDEGIPSESVAGDTMKAVFTWQRDQRTYLIGLELE